MTDQFATVWAAVIAASATIIGGLLVYIFQEKARSEERAQVLADRMEERRLASESAAEIARQRVEDQRAARDALEKERVQGRAERERDELYLEGKTVAKSLLAVLADLQARWRQDMTRGGTYPYEGEVSARIRNLGLLIPNADVREMVDEGMDVIDHIWVAEAVGELGAAKYEQRKVLAALMREVGAFILRDSQHPALLKELRDTNKLIAEANEVYEEGMRE